MFLCRALLFCISSSLLAESKTAGRVKEEHIDAKSVQIKPNGIFVKKNGKEIVVEALYTDKNGKLVAVIQTQRIKGWARDKRVLSEKA